jgi:hypothetical protein
MIDLKVTKAVSLIKPKLTLADLRDLMAATEGMSDSAKVSVIHYDNGYFDEPAYNKITVTESE